MNVRRRLRDGSIAVILAASSVLAAPRAGLAASGRELVWPGSIEALTERLSSEDLETRRSAADELWRLPASIKARLLPGLFADADPEIRLAAADAAAAMHWPEAGARASAWLGDPDVRVRTAAAEVLAVVRHPESVPGLGRLLEDQDSSVRAAAALALGNSRESEASILLMGHLDDVDAEVRRAVISALEQLGDTRAVVPLIGRIQEARASLRRQAVMALGKLGDPRAASALMVALTDGDATVRAAAARSLGEIGATEARWALARLLENETDVEVATAAVEALGSLGSSEAWAAIVSAAERPALPREAIERALASGGSAALPALEQCVLSAAPAETKRVCAAALGAIGGEQATLVLNRGLRQGLLSPAAALSALGRARHAAGLPAVLEYSSSANAVERRAAVDALALLLDPLRQDGLAVEPLVAALERARGARREQAALIGLLGRTGSPRVTPHLLPFTDAGDEYLRAVSIEALAQVKAPGVDEALLAALDSDSFPTRWTAALALARVGGPASTDALLARIETSDPVTGEILGMALGGPLSHGASAAQLERLERLLSHARGKLKDGVIEALSQVPGPPGLALLERRLPLSGIATRAKIAEVFAGRAESLDSLRRLAADPAADVRANAIWSLGTLGGSADLPLVTSALSDRDIAVASNAAAALARIGARTNTDASAELCRALADPRSYVRANALSGLRILGAHCQPASKTPEWLLEHHPSAEVRLAAARLIQADAKWAGDAARALRSCAARDLDGQVAAVCSRREGPASPEGDPVRHPVHVWVVPRGWQKPAPGAPFALVRGDGLIRSGTSDRRGALFEPMAPAGELRLAIPAVFAD